MNNNKSFFVEELMIIRSRSRRDWPNLPWDLLFRIIESSFSMSDYIRFGSVCVQWRFFYLENYHHIKLTTHQSPMFLYSPNCSNPDPPSDDQMISTGRIFSLIDRKVYDIRFPFPCYKNFRGSTHGWLVSVDEEKPYSVRLFNPFCSTNKNNNNNTWSSSNKGQVINLPPLFQIHEICSKYSFNYANKIVLSGSPSLVSSNDPKSSSSSNSFVAMALIRGIGWKSCLPNGMLSFFPCGLGYCRPGDSAWTPLSLEAEWQHLNDLVYYKDKFYVIENYGTLVSIDFGGCFPHLENEPKSVRVIGRPMQGFSNQSYLLESLGDLLLVYQYNCMLFVKFEVFKLVGFVQWVQMKTLEDRILFLSDNGSMSASASDCPGFKPNCIYYAEAGYNSTGQSSRIGVFDLHNWSLELHDMEAMIPLAHTIWIQPTL